MTDSTAWSHPPKPRGDQSLDSAPIPRLLFDHTKGVRDQIRDAVSETPPLTSGTPILTVAEPSAWCHDIPKLTPWFQTRVGNPNAPDVTPEYNRSRNHAALAGAATWYALDAHGVSTREKLIGLTAVVQHHGAYPDLKHDIFTNHITHETLWNHVFPEQLTAINNLNHSIATELLDNATPDDHVNAWDDFTAVVRDGSLQETIETAVTPTSENPFIADTTEINAEFISHNLYIDILRVWSALTSADALDAAEISRPPVPHETVTQDHVTQYIQDLPDAETRIEQELNAKRNAARDEALATAAATNADTYELTLPTGLGKTLTGIQTALKLRATDPGTPGSQNIIYALPYTSIIDQTAETLTNVFNSTPAGDVLTVHHHLQDTMTEPRGEVYTDSIARLAGEAWLTDITLTTFVQLFESLTAPQKSESYKLPQLHNSIILIDEPQLLQLDWWPIITHLTDYLTDQFNATVIFMTATQPALTDTQETVKLITDSDTYTPAPRVTYRLHESLDPTVTTGIEIPTAATEIVDTVLNDGSDGGGIPDGDTLAVCNTIHAARALYESVTESLTSRGVEGQSGPGPVYDLHELFDELYETPIGADDIEAHREAIVDGICSELETRDTGVVTCQVTARHRPWDRSVLIDVVDRLTESRHTVVLVSTQVVDAGVDLSFKYVYRDFAPIDSIVQTAGRCNRSYEYGAGEGEVTVWQLVTSTGVPCEQVYASSGQVNRVAVSYNALSATGSDLETESETVTVHEEVMRECIAEYQSLLQERRSTESGVVKALDEVTGKSARAASMIGDGRETTQVIVPRTRGEVQAVTRLQELAGERKSGEFDDLFGDVQKLSVSVSLDSTRDEEIVSSLPVLQRVEIPYVQRVSSPWLEYGDGVRIPSSTVADRIL